MSKWSINQLLVFEETRINRSLMLRRVLELSASNSERRRQWCLARDWAYGLSPNHWVTIFGHVRRLFPPGGFDAVLGWNDMDFVVYFMLLVRAMDEAQQPAELASGAADRGPPAELPSVVAVREHWRAVGKLFPELLQGARPGLDADGRVLWPMWEMEQFLAMEKQSRR